ncbi:ATP-binding cassette sub-family A member 1-like [Elysia marginata]|uniref:ATP-binding cassette sub-family A member 1-like n=1 Tax=Elysia marginata TaxID=1093978 RepID=A0AAV4FY16_9GAST|nr:ATP-binding cassette sub-family A member 1-like [Elysia marginata]
MAHHAILGLISTAEQLQGSVVDPQSVDAYLNPIVNWANSLQTPQGTAGMIGLCNSMVYFVNETRAFQAMGRFISPIMSSMKLVTDMVKLIPELDELTCIFFSDTGYDLTGAISKIESVGIWQDIEKGKLLNQPAQELANLLCDPARLSQVMQLSRGLSLSVSNISQTVCNTEVLNIAAFLTNMSLPLQEMEKLMPKTGANLADIIEELAQDVGALVTEFGNVVQLMTGLVSEVDLEMLKDQVPTIDNLIQGKGLSKMAGILNDIMDTLTKALPSSPETNSVLNEVRQVLNGMLAMDTLKDTLVEEIQVKDLAKDPAYLNAYLRNLAGFNENITQTIMDAVFSSRVFLQTSEAANATCEEVLRRILILNGTGMSVAKVKDAVCDLSEDQIKTLLDQLTPQLDVGDIVVKYVTHTTASVLTSANVTTTELDDLVDTMDKGLANLKLASDIITKNNGSRFLDAVFNASTMGYGMAALSPSLCGTDVQRLFEADFPTGSIILTSPDVASLDGVSHTDRVSLERDDLPNEFCVQVYETVKNSNLGNVLWAYLKPIMRGKILYTPDSPTIREIIREANATFETFAKVYEVSKMWADKAGNLKAMTDTLQDVESLEVCDHK